MATFQGRSRESLRVSIGYNLPGSIGGRALYVSDVSALGSGSNTTDFDDNSLRGGADDHNGKWIICTSGTNDGVITRVSNYVVANNRVTVAPGVTANFAADDTYEMWDEEFPPAVIHDYINQAIIEATGHFYDPIENITLFADGDSYRYGIPSGISMINRLQYRSKVKQKVIHSAGAAWTAGTNVTIAADTELKKHGNASNKLTIGSVSAGDVIAYKDITSVNLSDYTHIEWWARASFTTTSADYKLLLDDTATSASPIELLDFPVLTADTWTFCRVALAKADQDTAIISVGVEDDVGDNDNQTLWIDDVRAVHNDETEYEDIPNQSWRIDKEGSDIVFTHDGRHLAGYGLLKIVGGDKPVTLTSDATATEVPDEFIIARATGLALATNPDTRSLSGYWMNVANRELSKMPMLVDVRLVA